LIAVPAGVRIHLALGATDMRKSFDGLALLVQGKRQYGSVKRLSELPDGPPQAVCATPPGT